MARIIRARPIDHRDARRDGVVARARSSELRLALPLRQRLALRRLIAAADAKRRQQKEFA
jgi:hypothetical protein